MAKLYINTDHEDFFQRLEFWKDYLLINNLEEIELTEGKMEVGEDHFFCTHEEIMDFGEKGSCGRQCEHYEPRNKISGRCRYSKNCYEETDKKYLLHKNGKLKKLT